MPITVRFGWSHGSHAARLWCLGLQAWLTAKVFALIAYVELGVNTLTLGKTKKIRIFAMFAALMTFAQIVAVALTRDAAIFCRAIGFGFLPAGSRSNR